MKTEGFLSRIKDDGNETFGQLRIEQDGRVVFVCLTLELPWRNNDAVTSCYPPGTYTVVKRWSPDHGDHWHVLVPNRAFRLIHIGNYAAGKKRDTKGCTLVGATFADINGDGFRDITASTATMRALNKALAGVKEFTLHVTAPHA